MQSHAHNQRDNVRHLCVLMFLFIMLVTLVMFIYLSNIVCNGPTYYRIVIAPPRLLELSVIRASPLLILRLRALLRSAFHRYRDLTD
jgi:hypothetical protein